jgi:hypothetical protein
MSKRYLEDFGVGQIFGSRNFAELHRIVQNWT